MKVALVHDYLVQYGGAERVLESFCNIFPDAPIYTLLYNKNSMHGAFNNKKIITSSLQDKFLASKYHRMFPMLMPSAIEEFDFSMYDLVLSDSSSFAKGIITKPETIHISYVHTPMRYAWDDCQKYTQDFGFPFYIEKIIPFLINPLRIWDRVSSNRIDYCIANSKFVSGRIKKYWGKESTVINPPVNIEKFFSTKLDNKEDYYLMVGRLINYKRFDIAIKAFNKLNLPLKIIGSGPQEEKLKKIAGSKIEFVGRISDEKLPEYYAKSRGFLFPQEEDFGIVAIEAMASGTPIIAYRGGDIVEHMIESKEGVFFDNQTVSDLVKAVEKFEKIKFDYQKIREKALRFDKKIFESKIKKYIDEIVK